MTEPEARGPRERILDTAADLFYRQGYSNTGINQILEESGAHKASLYRYFPAKHDLGRAYLERMSAGFENFLDKLAVRGRGPEDFARTWGKLLLRDVRNGRFYGCPVANFRNQLDNSEETLAANVGTIIDAWIDRIAAYLTDEQRAGRFPRKRNSRATAVAIMKIYQGSVQLYRMTGNARYIESFPDEFVREVRR